MTAENGTATRNSLKCALACFASVPYLIFFCFKWKCVVQHAIAFVIWRVTIIILIKKNIQHNHLPIKEFKTMYTYKNVAISINLQNNHKYKITTNYIVIK